MRGLSRVFRFVGGFVLVWVVCCCVSAGAFALPDGRVYELVSPVYKGGYGAEEMVAVEPGGESVVFTSRGGFAGALSGGAYAAHDYLARRGQSGWSTGSFEPAFGGLSDVSANLEYGLATGSLGPNSGAENYSSTEEEFQLHRSDTPDTVESWEAFGGIVMKRLDKEHLSAAEGGASADLCHIVLVKAEAAIEGPLLSGAIGANSKNEPIYDLSRGCGGGEPSLRLVGVKNDEPPTRINPSCPVELGTGSYVNNATGLEQGSDVNAVDATGDEMFFTTNVQEESPSCHQGAHQQLFVRLGGARTVEVSRPFEGGLFGGCVANGVRGEVPCEGALARASAYFKGASEDGSRVFFTTTASLTDKGEKEGNNLYMATIGCPGVESLSETQSCEASQREVTSLAQVSHDPVANQAAEVQGVVNIAADGSHVYFVARGVLTSKPGGGCDKPSDLPCEMLVGEGCCPKVGADNLYAYNSVTGETAFVAELCSGPERSGVAEDVHCPRNLTEGGGDAELLWSLQRSEAQSTVDGNFLVFCSYGQLVPGDTDDAKDVYRYDAQTGSLDRVSIGENDYDADGNNSLFDANIQLGSMGVTVDLVSFQQEMGTHAISKDGSRIVFDTAEPLSPNATNGKVNIYEWDEGSVSLISSGTSEEDDTSAMITASGRDILFITAQGLVREDTDGLPDIYDARVGGGFPPQPTERQPCSGDACQGPLTNPAPLLVPGSVSQAPGGNFVAPASKPVVKIKKTKVKKTKAKKKVKKERVSHGVRKAPKAAGRRGR